MKKTALYIFLLFIAGIVLSSCKKQTVSSPANSFESVKVYNDSTIYYPIGMAAGNNRIAMYYNTLNLNSTIYGTGILQTDNAGNLQWNYIIPKGFYYASVAIQSDGSTLFIGLLYDASYYADRYFMNAQGKLILKDSINFIKTFNYFEGFTGLDILQPTTGNILIYGSFNSYPPDYTKSFVAEYDPAGNMVWAKVYYFPVSSNSEGTAIENGISTPDGGYMFCGTYSTSSNTIFVMKTDASGNTLWTKFYPANEHAPYSITPTLNGNYFLCTIPNYTTNTFTGIYTISSSGDSLGYTQIDNIQSTVSGNSALSNGGIYFLNNGTANSNTTLPYINQNTLFTELNPDLALESQGNFQTAYPDHFSSACLTSDGNLACFGMIQSFGKSYFDPELIIIKGQ